jgi:hypothetical protein
VSSHIVTNTVAGPLPQSLDLKLLSWRRAIP